MKNTNVVFLSKYIITSTKIIKLNTSKQALKITIMNHNNNIVQFVGIHLTSDYQTKADVKRKEQITIILNNIDRLYPCFIIGDYNISTDNIPQLIEYSYKDVTNDIDCDI